MTTSTIQCDDVAAEHETHSGFRVVANGRPGGLNMTPVTCPGLTAGTCTPERCVNLNDPAAQANCSLC